MIRKLLIVFASGIVLSIVMLSGAWAIGGRDLAKRIDEHGGLSLRIEDEDEPSGPALSRTLPFDASRVLTVSVPVSLEFTRGDQARMTVSGPAEVIEALRWEDGRLSSSLTKWHNRELRVRITAPQLVGLVLTAPGQVEMRGLDQPALALDVRSPAEVEATGRVDRLVIANAGVGDLDLEDLEARDAKASLSGVGSIDLAASGTVEAEIAGAGEVVLHRKPAVLTTRVTGLGTIRHDY